MTQPEKLTQKEILCPECSEPCLLSLRNFKISLANCKNGHKKENISLSEYEEIKKKQNLDSEKKYYVCSKHNETFEKYCENCKLNMWKT